MNKVILVLLGLVALAAATPLLTKDFVDHINSVQSQWVATHDNRFANMSVEEVKGFLGTELRESNYPKVSYEALREFVAVPDNFDSRTTWKNCIHPIRDQARCGSCWAFGAAEAQSDRLCIASGEKINLELSTQDMVSCDKNNFACQGGYLDKAWDFIVSKGLVTESCWPYSSASGAVEACRSTCKNSETWTKFKAKNRRSFRSAADAKTDIQANGPLETGFQVYQDFMSYKSGIYKHTSGGLLGGHAVKVVGWGLEGSTRFWIAANSWNAGWGESGFFRIQEGQCGFDSNMIVADPVF